MALQGKVIVVTGASSGIGLALCKAALHLDMKVVAAARNQEALNELSQYALQNAKQLLCVKTDVNIEEDCANLIQKAIERFSSLDILINNAGISMRAVFEDVDLNVLKQLMQTNFWGAVYCTKYALPHLLKSKGSVAGVSSIAGFQGLPARTGYSASKFALHGFLQTLRVETLNQGLHVMIVCPGFTASNIRNTALTQDGSPQGSSPLEEGKLMTAEEVADRILRGVARRKRTLIMTTEGKLVVLLGKLMPKLVDGLVYKKMKKEHNSPLK